MDWSNFNKVIVGMKEKTELSEFIPYYGSCNNI